MTTRNFASVVDHTSNAGFQAWATELYNELIAAGLTPTTDTGQLAVPVVAARPGVSAVAGYWTFRFNDTHQGASPVVIKIEPGTSGGAAIPGLYVTIGTGSNGSGTINGTVWFPRVMCGMTSAFHSTVVPYSTFICVTDGFFGLAWKSLGTGTSMGCGYIQIERTPDVNGDPTAAGVHAVYQNAGSTALAKSFDAGTGTTVTSTVGTWCLIHYGLTATPTGAGNFQLFQHVGVQGGEVIILNGRVTCLYSEVPFGTTVSFAAIGTTPHTYINIGAAALGAIGLGGAVNTHAFLMRFE